MKTIVIIEVEHRKPIAELEEKVAQRAYTIDGVSHTVVMRLQPVPFDPLKSYAEASEALGQEL